MTYCEHVYQNIGLDVCPKCEGYTHEVDWAKTTNLHIEHHASGKADKYKCPDCGGTIRVWWDI